MMLSHVCLLRTSGFIKSRTERPIGRNWQR